MWNAAFPLLLMIRLGITGNIGCGKSTVGKYLKAKGFPVIDSDEIVHELLASSNEYTQKLIQICKPENIISEDPDKYFISREKLGKILFADLQIKAAVEAVLHPACAKITTEFFHEQQKARHQLAANLIPLLFETGAKNRYDVTWLLYCEPQIQRQRLQSRNPNLDPEDILRRINSQLPQESKKSQVDFVIDNSGSIEQTQLQVDMVLKELIKL